MLARRITAACAMVATGTALLVGCATMERNERHGERHALTSAAEQAVKAEFPNAKIEKVKWARENGVGAFALNLSEGQRKYEARVSRDGIVLEAETLLNAGELPQAVAEALAKSAPGEMTEISKVEVRAEVKLVKLPAARMSYEVEVVKHYKRGEIGVATDGSIVAPLKWEHAKKGEGEDNEDKEGDNEERSDGENGGEGSRPAMNMAELLKVAGALQKQMPQARLGAVTMENEDGVALYEVKLTAGESRIEAEVAGDGTVAEIETKIAAKDLPAAVAATVAKAAPDARIIRAEKKEMMADVRMTRLVTPKVAYDVDVKGKGEVEVTPDGVILKRVEAD